MESTGSFTPAADDTSLQSPVIRADDNSLEQQSASWSRVPSSAPTEVIYGFKCSYCACRFATKRGRGGHERVHSDLPQFREKQNKKKEHRGLARAGPPQLRISLSSSRIPVLRRYSHAAPLKSYRRRTHNFLSAAHSGALPLFPGTGAGGLAPAQPSSAAAGGGGHVGILHPVNQENTTQFYSWFVSVAVPSFVCSGTSGLPQPSLAAQAPVAVGNNGGTGDGIHLGGQQAMPGVNQEEIADGIDLTLRL